MTISLKDYLQRKAELPDARLARPYCVQCRKPGVSCYCEHVERYSTRPRIVILMHPLEAKHPVGTGRMAHRCLENSHLWIDFSFTHSAPLNALLANPKLYPILLFPNQGSRNLSIMSHGERGNFLPADREPVIIVLDATWEIAKKMLHLSPNLQTLPRICFTPPRPSGFLVRKQPHGGCFSTIEAIHETLSLLDPDRGSGARPYDHLLQIFDAMVAKQLSFRQNARGKSRHCSGYLARKARRQKAREERDRKLGEQIHPQPL
jgi:DTW domain-containing protein YfiP